MTTEEQKASALAVINAASECADYHRQFSSKHITMVQLIKAIDSLRTAAAEVTHPDICQDCGAEMIYVCSGLEGIHKRETQPSEPVPNWHCMKCANDVHVRNNWNTCPNCRAEGYLTKAKTAAPVADKAHALLAALNRIKGIMCSGMVSDIVDEAIKQHEAFP